MKPLRLLAIIEASSMTGPAKNLLEFARRAADHAVFTTIATFTRDAKENQFTESVGAAAAACPAIALETITERGPFDRKNLDSLQALTARIRPDVVQTHAVKSHFLARSAGLHRAAPWVAFHHGYTWPTLKARAYNQLDRWSLRAATRVLTVSLPFRDELVAKGVPAGRIEIIHNAIPAGMSSTGRSTADPSTKEAGNLRERMKIPGDAKVVVIVGRLSREKDHLTLLEAISRLPPAHNPHLTIIGEGPERARIEDAVRRLGLQDHVILTGQQPSAEPWYGIADVAVLSSLSEGSPNALLEAMAAGVPSVATRVGGVPEIVADEESALLVAPGDPVAMSAAIFRLLTEPDLAEKLVSRSRELIVEHHQPEARTRKLVEIYRAAANPLGRSQSS
jgi:glycosyltransferase involved in cell wall biosynthesis